MNYVWDKNKNERNYWKHGIRFEDALHVFEDPDRLEYYDDKHSIDEDRYITIGIADHVLYVVYTQRYQYTRIISARYATTREEELYYGCNLLS